jgi:hypothetical protein
MKKTIVILLMLLLAANISGAGVSYHYCGNFFQYLSVDFQSGKNVCTCGVQKKTGVCKGNKKNNCCKTEHRKVTVDEGKTFVKQLIVKAHFGLETIVPPVFIQYEPCLVSIVFHYKIPLGHAPPFVRTVSIHILNQQFLI